MEGAVHCAEVVGQVVYHGRLRRQNSVRFGGEAEITQQIGAFDWVFALDGVQNGCVPSASLGRRQWGWFKVTAGIYEFAVEEHLADKGGVQPFIHDTSNRALIHDMDVGETVKTQETRNGIGIHVSLAIAIEDPEGVALEVEHHLVEARVGKVSLAF
jgi:hypothetical protein